MLTKIKRFRESLRKLSKKDLAWFLLLANVIIWAVAYNQTNRFYNHYIELLTQTASASPIIEETAVTSEITQTLQPTPKNGSKEWILAEAEANNIDPIKVNCLITHESGWNVNARNVNDLGSVDLGLFQWNTKYQIDTGFISVGGVGNPECETYKFIEKVKQDQNFLAWHGYTNHCQWLGTDPFINK